MERSIIWFVCGEQPMEFFKPFKVKIQITDREEIVEYKISGEKPQVQECLNLLSSLYEKQVRARRKR
jgi:hypothetical protein